MAMTWAGKTRWWMSACVLAFSLAAAGEGPDAAPRQLYAEPSPLARVIAGAGGASEAARLDLAVLIVEALVSAYESELDEALRAGARDAGDRRKLERWQRSVAPVLSELRVARAALYGAREVELHADRHDRILLLIDGRPSWIAWPRVSLENRLEREIAAEFCGRHECPTAGREGVRQPAAVQGGWVLSQGRPPGWESVDGLRCEFPDLASRGEREATCRALATDLHALAAALREAARRGQRIEWSHLALDAGSVGLRQRVVVNARGDYLAVAVPELAGNRVDWAEVRRWLQARSKGRRVLATVLGAADDR
ncbi:hypothetical protein [Thioalkalivibrio sp.]|uniref:hypothetical protein n=1 Tax=Thioalkalivibrio sp. TaxID=2093813 RepID=UPI0035646DC1